MALTIETLSLTPAQTKAALRVNAAMALTPRLKPAGWKFRLGLRLNQVAGRAAARISALALKKRGIAVSGLSTGPADTPVAIRLLEPDTPNPRGLVIDLHGGGWVIGSAALNDPLTRHLAEAGLVVASVDYRLLDEARLVTVHDAVDDCVAALRWAIEEGASRFGVEHVFLIGESAGAHLSALALLKLRDAGETRLPPCIFVQGAFDLSGTPSVRAAGPNTLLFDGPNLKRDLALIAPERDEAGLRAPDLSPLYADLSGMPPALFVMSEIDPLRDDSRQMAERWAEVAPTVLLDVPTAPHGFQHFGAPTAALAQDVIRRWIFDHTGTGPVSVENTNH